MNIKHNKFLSIKIITVILLFSVVTISAQKSKSVKNRADKTIASTLNKAEVEKIVRDYLLRNPAVIREAMLALQIKEEKEKQDRGLNSLKSKKSEIFADINSPVIGNKNGDVAIVVFFDYFCGYCRKNLPELSKLLEKDSSVKVVFKEFPILGEQSVIAAKAALAAARQGKYLEFHKVLLEAENVNEEVIKTISGNLGLNYEKLQIDMKDVKIKEAINRTYSLAESLNIDGTPAYIIGDQIIPGAVNAEFLAKAVSAERAKRAISKVKK